MIISSLKNCLALLFRLRGERNCADAARAHKRVDTCGFHPLVNHPFSLGKSGADCLHVTASKMGNGSRVTAACLSPPFRSSQTAYCYTDGLLCAERGIAVPRKS